MPRYFFSVNDQPDPEGVELSDISIAKCHAVKLAGRVICDDHSETFWEAAEWRMIVTNALGLALFELLMIGTEAPAIRPLDSLPRA